MKRLVLTILLQCFVLASAEALEEKNNNVTTDKVDDISNIIDIKKEYLNEKIETVSLPELSKNQRKKVKKQLFKDLTLAHGVIEEMRKKLTDYKLQITNSLKKNIKVDNKIKKYIETMVVNFSAAHGLNTNVDAYRMIGLVSEYMYKLANNKPKNDLNDLISIADKNGFINYISILSYLSKEDRKKIDEFFDVFKEVQQLFNRLAAIVDEERLKFHANEVNSVLSSNGIHIIFIIEIRASDDAELMAKDDRDKLWRVVMEIKNDTPTADNIVNLVFELCEARQVVLRMPG